MQHAASVGIMPTLNRKIATADAPNFLTVDPWALALSVDNGNARMGTVSRKTVWIANQIARLRITPTTAAVMADSAALSGLLPRSFSTNGAPRKIQRKHGVKVTHVASKPPSVPASMGGSEPGSR